MYFNSENNFYHGIMFHHFHDDGIHSKSQGSISKDDFYNIIKFIGRKNILNADEFFFRSQSNELKENNVCLTFDDGIKCQIDIALPVLEDLKIKGFFFLYSSLLSNKPDLLELHRYFRVNYFKNMEEFYDKFFMLLNMKLDKFFILNSSILKNMMAKYSFYSLNDAKFRVVRNELLSKKEYDNLMFLMFEEKKFIPEKHYNDLFFKKNDLIQLHSLGHLIGLHSHNHPTTMEKLNYEKQKEEYQKNLDVFSEILNVKKSEIKFMSHPCGSYNNDTLEILKNLGIKLGFKQIMKMEPNKGMKKINNSSLEIARQDHVEIIKMMNK
jgi:peptidoglycan/xylan/chitin deacetylase (PgdA/CDA1 family)